jgi:hypothetical protein
MPDPTPTADELRSAAVYVEEGIAAYPVEEPPLVIGDAQSFPRERPDARPIGQAIAAAQDSAAQASAKLLLLAALTDAGEEVPSPMLSEVRPYLDAYRQAKR